jgi:hypothetical protein
VNKVDDSDDKFIIFSIINTKTNKLIALESLRTKSSVKLATFDGSTVQDTETLSINPTDPEKGQVVYLVKNKVLNPENEMKNEIYFVNCKYDAAASISRQDPFQDCYTKLSQLKASLSSSHPFFCVPTNANMGDLNR